jgi:fumarate hydratase subunit beta
VTNAPAAGTPKPPIRLRAPFSEEDGQALRAGDEVLLSGVVYTARDAAHERLAAMVNEKKPLPVDLRGQVIYYCGPTPARPGRPIGSAGPTTASRMDRYTPGLIAHGVRGMIGKGRRSRDVREAIQQFHAVYFGAIEGTAALLGQRVQEAEIVAFPDLGTEAIHRLVIREFPVVVVNDTVGGDLYVDGQARYRRG